MDKAKVTIIVPVYNTYMYIEKCVKSLMEQDYKNIQVLLIDDGSALETAKVCDELCEKYKEKVNVIHKKNGGTSSAKNCGIDMVTSEFIAFLDSDDYVGPKYISDLINLISEEKSEIAVMGYTVCYEKNNSNIDVLPQKTKKKVCIQDAVRLMGVDGILNVDVSKLYVTEIIKKNNIRFQESFSTGEDLIFNCDYLSCIDSATIDNGSNYYYIRRETESLVNKYRENIFDISKYLLERVSKLYRDLNMDLHNDKVNIANFYCDYMVNAVSNLFRKECTKNGKERRAELSRIFKFSQNSCIEITNRKNIFCKLFMKLYSKNVYFSESVYRILFFLRNNFSKIYVWFRTYVVLKKGKTR